jgi:hypothetical protein
MSDLWTEATHDYDGMARQAARDGADAELRGMFPFLAGARSKGELEHRLALAGERLTAIATRHGLEVPELEDMARRRWALLVEALNEGVDPLQVVVQDSGASGGPEKPDEHSGGPDFSHGYSEIPQGAPGGPVPNVVAPVPPQMGPVQEATGARQKCSKCSCGTNKKGQCKGCKSGSCSCKPGASCMQPSVTASADPVRRQVLAVTASIQATNPGVSDDEAGRIARRVVGRYLTADLTSQVTSDSPGQDAGGSYGGGGGGTGMAGHMLEWQGAKSLMGGGGEAAGAGEAAGGAAGLGELAELAPLAAL